MADFPLSLLRVLSFVFVLALSSEETFQRKAFLRHPSLPIEMYLSNKFLQKLCSRSHPLHRGRHSQCSRLLCSKQAAQFHWHEFHSCICVQDSSCLSIHFEVVE